jgi:hypothetical protein
MGILGGGYEFEEGISGPKKMVYTLTRFYHFKENKMMFFFKIYISNFSNWIERISSNSVYKTSVF